MTAETSSSCGCGTDDPRGQQSCECGAMPQVTFSTFILSLASSALVQLGEVPDPESGRTKGDLVMAKHSIDVLTMLQDKTKECLDPDESRLLDGVLYELRMKYVIKKG